MPLYEEKVISPLALRFSQQRIRHTFQDGRDVEASIKEITTGPAVDGYDVVLQAPFPTIEIIRYSPNGRGGHGEDDHWFTFDNRRLYCLQRVAAEYWPKRVGAVVEVLYADNGAIRKKLDSLTCGSAISIGHAFATAAELDSWDWRQDVEERAPPGLPLAEKAENAVDADDAKTGVSELANAPGAESSMERLARHLAASEPSAPVPFRKRVQSEDSGSNHETPSTTATEILSGSEAPEKTSRVKKSSTPAPLDSTVMEEHLTGVWTGDKGETYTVSWLRGQWHCVREDGYCTKKFSIEQDDAESCLWWGIQRTYYCNMSDLTEKSEQLRWYGARDQPGRRPRFSWHKVNETWEEDDKSWQAQDPSWSAPQKQQQAWPEKKWPARQQKQQPASALPKKQQPAPAQAKKAGQSKQWVAVANSGGA